MNRQDLKLKEELIKILYKWVHTEHENGLAPMPTEELFTLIKKHEREVIGKFEHRIHKLRAMIPLTGGTSARNEAKDILELLAKLKEVKK